MVDLDELRSLKGNARCFADMAKRLAEKQREDAEALEKTIDAVSELSPLTKLSNSVRKRLKALKEFGN